MGGNSDVSFVREFANALLDIPDKVCGIDVVAS
jgi:hypothetical protein